MPGILIVSIRLACLFLSVSSIAASSSIWSFNIDEGPAPPVEDEPPFSRHASRDRSLLKYQIPGIIVGYLGFVIILGFALLTFGRRARRAAQSSRPTEMVKPSKRTFDPSPISPSQSFTSWRRWGHKRTGTSSKSPHVRTAQAFDTGIVEADKARQQREMEGLYAAVIAQDKEAAKTDDTEEHGRDSTISWDPSETSNLPRQSSRDFMQTRLDANTVEAFYPPELAYLNAPVQAIYPPYAPMPSDPQDPTSSIYALVNAPTSESRSSSLPTNPRSGLSHSRQSSSSSPVHKAVRKTSSLRISTTPDQKYNSNADITGPRSPHPIARTQLNYQPTSPLRDDLPWTPYPQTEAKRNVDEDEKEISATDIIHSYSYEGLDEPRPLPSAAPHRAVATSSRPSTSSPHSFIPSKTQTPASAATTSANNSSQTLPLRMHASTSPLNITTTTTSPTPTRTTFLSPRRDRFHLAPGIPSARLISAGLATPYSAYMPFSPVTPVTPGLRSRAERKREEREEARRVPTLEEDGVVPEGEMWGDGW